MYKREQWTGCYFIGLSLIQCYHVTGSEQATSVQASSSWPELSFFNYFPWKFTKWCLLNYIYPIKHFIFPGSFYQKSENYICGWRVTDVNWRRNCTGKFVEEIFVRNFDRYILKMTHVGTPVKIESLRRQVFWKLSTTLCIIF